MAGILGSIASLLAWVVIIMLQFQMAEMRKRISKLEDAAKLTDA